MKVSISQLEVSMELGNNGVTFAVYSNDGKEYLGKLIVGKAGVTWCKGRTQPQNGIKLTWEKLIDVFNQQKA